jgi:hypothetical protein
VTGLALLGDLGASVGRRACQQRVDRHRRSGAGLRLLPLAATSEPVWLLGGEARRSYAPFAGTMRFPAPSQNFVYRNRCIHR